ncbi:MAG: D-alanine--D-alanine ligase [Candidatus Omnitrophota bacterium]
MKELDALRKYEIGVLAGGSSSEREISLKSGRAVFDALREAGLDAALIDVKEDDFALLVNEAGIDLAFIALHGRFGEDGTVQKMLFERGVLYTGSGPEASRMALDKIASKERLSGKDLKTPEYMVTELGESIPYESVWFPCVVKPQHEGSSIGLTVVSSKEHLAEAVDRASNYSRRIIIEKFIEGREITVGILENRALPVVEIVPEGGCYDFNAKYQSANTRYIVPADIDEDVFKRAQETAVNAHNALGCEEFSRVDMRLSSEGELFILEVNTIPGLTERSLLPMAAKAVGLSFTELCVKILVGAIRKVK